MSTPLEPQGKPKRNMLAIASLILGMLAIAFAQFCFTPGLYSVLGCLGGIAALFAVAAGVMGVRAARTLDGQGQRPAIAGVVTAAFGLLLLTAQFIPTMLTRGGLWNHVLATPVPAATPTPTVTSTPVPTATPVPTITPTPAPQTYRGDGFMLTLPGDWTTADASGYRICREAGITCARFVHSTDHNIDLMVIVIRQIFDQEPGIEELKEIDQQVLAQYESVNEVSMEEIVISGKPAIKRRFAVSQTSGGQLHILQVLVANGNDLYQFTAQTPDADSLTRYQATLEGIIASTQFIEPTPSATDTPIPPPQTYYGDGFTLTFPGDWLEIDMSSSERCSPSNITCFLIVHSTEEEPEFFLIRETHSDEPDLETLDQEMWDQYEGAANLISKDTIEVAGQLAIRRTFVMSSPSSPTGELYILRVIVVNGYDEYRFTAAAPTADTFLRYQATMNEIIASLQFTQ